MPLQTRILNVIFEMSNGDKVVLDHTIQVSVKVHKTALEAQSRCSIQVFNLTKTRREQLLSQFTAWNKRLVEETPIALRGLNPYINVTVEAGYSGNGKNASAVVFEGQVVEVTIGNGPPDLAVNIDCYSRQLDKTTTRTDRPPPNATFKEYAQWVADQTDSPLICETSFNDVKSWNQFASTQIVSNLIIDLQNMHKPDVVAFYENGTLIVRDLNRKISTAEIVELTEFIGTPMYTKYGMSFKVLFNPRITLTSAVNVHSLMNPSLDGYYVLQTLDYELSSRDTNFYVSGEGCPPTA